MGVIQLIFPDCFLLRLILKLASYSVHVHLLDHDWFRFLWCVLHLRFACLPQGFTSAPWVLSVLLKPGFFPASVPWVFSPCALYLFGAVCTVMVLWLPVWRRLCRYGTVITCWRRLCRYGTVFCLFDAVSADLAQ